VAFVGGVVGGGVLAVGWRSSSASSAAFNATLVSVSVSVTAAPVLVSFSFTAAPVSVSVQLDKREFDGPQVKKKVAGLYKSRCSGSDVRYG
jgi:hypothetical protein